MTSDRLQAYVREQFASNDVQPILDLLDEAVSEEPGETAEGLERVQAAILLFAHGDTQRLLEAIAIARGDWRDILVAGGLAHDGWADRLDIALRSS